MFSSVLFLLAFLHAGIHAAEVVERRAGGPVVSLDYATFQGASVNGTDQFLGVPYAQPPVGDLRFRRPRHPSHLSGTTSVSLARRAAEVFDPR